MEGGAGAGAWVTNYQATPSTVLLGSACRPAGRPKGTVPPRHRETGIRSTRWVLSLDHPTQRV